MAIVKSTNRGPKVQDLTGQRFGRWIVLSRGPYSAAGRTRWLCRCDCGVERMVQTNNLKAGRDVSCGCFRRERTIQSNTKHGMRRTPEYQTWSDMIARCYRPSKVGYERYGGRGITVCDRWKGSFAAFYSDMGPRLTPKHTIDRLNNDGPYSPENCEWKTSAEQHRNTSSNIILEFDGKTMCLSDWAAHVGINRTTIRKRLKYGWSIERALSTPPDVKYYPHSASRS